jgi:hypothetical protein
LATNDDRDAIERTISLYSHLVDFGRFDEWADLYTDDAIGDVFGGVRVWAGGPSVTELRGRKAIVEYVRGNVEPLNAQGLHLLHMATKPIIEIDGDSANAWWTYTVMAASADSIAVAGTGRYHAKLVRCPDDHWRFSVRICVESGGPLPDGELKQPPAH